LQSVIGVVERRQTMPVLANVRFRRVAVGALSFVPGLAFLFLSVAAR
jgi:hypothetical protein